MLAPTLQLLCGLWGHLFDAVHAAEPHLLVLDNPGCNSINELLLQIRSYASFARYEIFFSVRAFILFVGTVKKASVTWEMRMGLSTVRNACVRACVYSPFGQMPVHVSDDPTFRTPTPQVTKFNGKFELVGPCISGREVSPLKSKCRPLEETGRASGQ